jgi:hypothetical protein
VSHLKIFSLLTYEIIFSLLSVIPSYFPLCCERSVTHVQNNRCDIVLYILNSVNTQDTLCTPGYYTSPSRSGIRGHVRYGRRILKTHNLTRWTVK